MNTVLSIYGERYVSICELKDTSYSMFFIMLSIDYNLPSFGYMAFKTEQKYMQTCF